MVYNQHDLVCAGFYEPSAAKNMLNECSKMYHFKHPNVLTLSGVCLDAGPAPYIIMPFMAKGSVLAYLKRNKATLNVSRDSIDDGEVQCHSNYTRNRTNSY